ncbi:hypothetical protein GGI26_004359 [Coemansia sp. RSA 1358]|nr:hypothetical protein GGI26_004359 [Coemansia sp. RSA 1358]
MTKVRWYAAPVHKFEKYDPAVVESDWYDWWQKRGLFKPRDSSDGGHIETTRSNEFSMLLPPPNVTGVLHIGHGLTLSIQDAIARWNRMHGRSVNWVPGTDHAGISLQSVVEKSLRRESGLTKYDLGREAFLKRAWACKNDHGDQIKQQTMKVGASLNWDQEYFTMDPQHSKVVQDAFIRLYEDGLIYRATKMVNWSCALQSVISDIEVDRIPTSGRILVDVPGCKNKVEFGVFHTIEFPVVDPPENGPSVIQVETTRPETMLGDVALAVNPADSRYANLPGRTVMHPLLKKEIPIISDGILVDPAFGTGVVKITPAHDVSDYTCAQHHSLPVVQVFGTDGRVVNDPGFAEFIGKSRWEIRQLIVKRLAASGAYLGKRDAHASVISRCSRSNDIIEPMLMPQWYVRCSDLAKHADGLVGVGKIDMIPARQKAIWHSWLSGIEDWCVSRQLWWGHRIPMYQVRWNLASIEHPVVWVAAECEQQAREKALQILPTDKREAVLAMGPSSGLCTIVQDEDVLDTWFSSGLLPISVFNNSSLNSSALEPATESANAKINGALSSVLETGQDILFFWVARMVMLCTYFAKVPPFSTVLLHPMVRDAQGRKMSKSLGNIIDPMDIINGAELVKLQDTLKRGYMTKEELARSTKELKRLYPRGFQRFGADSLRFTLILCTQQTQQINLSLDNVKASHHFCNKLWNAFRFVHMHANKLDRQIKNRAMQQCSNYEIWLEGVDKKQLTVFDRALLSRLHKMLKVYHRAMETYRLAVAAEAVRDFVQRDLCDRYIELSKQVLFDKADASTKQDPSVAIKILFGAIDVVLRALHPFMPYLSEELWQRHVRGDASDEMSVMECEWKALSSNGLIAHDPSAEYENEASIAIAFVYTHILVIYAEYCYLVFGVVAGIRSLRQQHSINLAAETVKDEDAAFIVAVLASQEKKDEQQRLLQMVAAHEAFIRRMSKETSVCMRAVSKDRTDGLTSCMPIASDTGGNNVASIIISPQVHVIARLADGLNPIAGQDSEKTAATVAKLEEELSKLRRMVSSDGYQKNAPETVKEADSE